MIGALRCTIQEIRKNPVLFFVGDIGYAVYITDKSANTIEPGKKCTLFIHSHIREDAFDLYGFETQEDLALFEVLLTVSGIGPKTALSIMNLGVQQIQRAVQSSDVDVFISVPRLGKKNAQKIIIELKNKLGSIEEMNLRDDASNELVEALVSMGFVKKEILSAIKNLPPSYSSLEEKMRYALKQLGSART